MMFEADAMAFPFLADVPQKTSSRLARVLHSVQAIRAAVDRCGALVPREMLPTLLDVSHQRVAQLVNEGQLSQVEIQGHRFVTEDSLVAWVRAERKAGRPRKVKPPTIEQSQEIAREIMKAE
jgi:uncharacterized protein (UPF0261 family)